MLYSPFASGLIGNSNHKFFQDSAHILLYPIALSFIRDYLLGGDFNFIFDSNLDKLGGNLEKGTVGSKAFKSVMDKFSLFDCFRHLHPRKRAVTWMRKNVQNFEMIGTRLDRFYAASILEEHLINFDTAPCSCSDHDYIVMNLGGNIEPGTSFGNS